MSKPVTIPRGRQLMDILERARPASLDTGPAAPPEKIAAFLGGADEAPTRSSLGTEDKAPPPRPARRVRRAALTGAGLAVTAGAAAVAVVLATPGGGAAPPPPRTVLTAAMVQRVATASRVALAQSGRAKITYWQRQNGVLQVSGTEDIVFAGKNWNDATSQTFPASPGQPASTQFAINRIVNGQAYYYIKGRTDKLRWYRDTNPSGHPSMKIPDPRALLGALNPSVQFHVAGYQVIGGMRLEELRASNPGRLPALNALPGAIPGARVTELNVWVDEHNVVRRMSLQQRETAAVTSIYFKHRPDGTFEVLAPSKADLKKAMADFSKLRAQRHVIFRVDAGLPAARGHNVQVWWVSVTFSGIGVPQVITAPSHAVAVYGHG